MKNKQININGQDFTTLSEAARYYSLPRATLVSRYKASNDGKINTDPVNASVIIGDTTYPSLTDASNTLGIHPATLKSRIKAGWKPDDIVNPESKQFSGKSVTTMGIIFPQVKEMLTYHNIDQTQYNRLIKIGHTPHAAVKLIRNSKKRRIAA